MGLFVEMVKVFFIIGVIADIIDMIYRIGAEKDYEVSW